MTKPLIAAALAVAALGGCAPDAMRNYQATGFNGYLDTLKRACPNMRIGSNDIGQWLQYGGGTDNYSYWLDMTSRMYYRRITVAEYRTSVAAQLGGGPADAGAFACIIENLPAQR
jgi:hypothetical protein